MPRAVFLDRDGVINAMVYDAEHGLVDSPANPAQFKLLPDVAPALRLLSAAGWLAVVVSNQPGIAKGKLTPALLDAITKRMHAQLAAEDARLDGVYYCLHHPEAVLAEYRQVCACRKPQPGLLLQAAADLQIDLARSVMVGDGVADVQAGRAAGCRTVFIGLRKAYLWATFERGGAFPDRFAGSLFQAVEWIRKTG